MSSLFCFACSYAILRSASEQWTKQCLQPIYITRWVVLHELNCEQNSTFRMEISINQTTDMQFEQIFLIMSQTFSQRTFLISDVCRSSSSSSSIFDLHPCALCYLDIHRSECEICPAGGCESLTEGKENTPLIHWAQILMLHGQVLCCAFPWLEVTVV